jgi:tRNA uridine 5-carbamoylmethylation protein Kti12
MNTEEGGAAMTKLITRFEVDNLEKDWERPLLHAFYWSAAMGDIDSIKKMINRFRWSPFMKSFK